MKNKLIALLQKDLARYNKESIKNADLLISFNEKTPTPYTIDTIKHLEQQDVLMTNRLWYIRMLIKRVNKL